MTMGSSPALHELVAATVTPMHSDGSINTSAIPPFIDFLVSTGVESVFVNGTTGEWASLSVNERKTLAEAWITHGKGKFHKIIIHCGALSLTDAKELAKHAQHLKADAIACIAPSFTKPPNEEYLVDYLSQVASSASSIPFIYYHIPSLTNVTIDMIKFLTLARNNIPTFAGLKLTTFDFHEVYQCLRFPGKVLDVYYGLEEQLLPALVMGVNKSIGHFYNFLGNNGLGKEFNEMIMSYNSGDINSAREKQMNISLDINTLFHKYGPSVIKLITSLLSGIDLGPNRLPMKNHFSDKEVDEIKTVLKDKGYLN